MWFRSNNAGLNTEYDDLRAKETSHGNMLNALLPGKIGKFSSDYYN